MRNNPYVMMADQPVPEATMMEQGNGDESTAGRPREAEPVKAASLVGSVIVSELKKKFDKKQN